MCEFAKVYEYLFPLQSWMSRLMVTYQKIPIHDAASKIVLCATFPPSRRHEHSWPTFVPLWLESRRSAEIAWDSEPVGRGKRESLGPGFRLASAVVRLWHTFTFEKSVTRGYGQMTGALQTATAGTARQADRCQHFRHPCRGGDACSQEICTSQNHRLSF